MSNKRNYEIVWNVTTNSVKLPQISVFNTDKNIFNFKLYIEHGTGKNIVRAKHDELAEYKVVLKTVKKKTNTYITHDGVLDTIGDFFLFDLPEKFSNAVDSYNCQLFLTDDKNTEDITTDDEVVTSNPFTYAVKPSITTDLNGAITSNPDLPIVENLINELKVLAGLTLEDPNTVFGDYEKKVDVPKKTLIEDGKIYLAKSDGIKIDSGTTLPLGVKREDLVVSNNSVTMTKSDVQNITISADTTVVLPSNVINQELYLNAKCNTKDSILTFKNGTETTKLKLAANSYNVFQISANGSDYIIERKSTDYPELTDEEINAGISNEGIDLSDYQTKTDASLKTISKTIVGAINENSSQIKDKANKVDLEVERKRIDNFTKLGEGSTTGDAELIDIRVGVDGFEYKNAGTSIREQVKPLYEILNTPNYIIKSKDFKKNGGNVVYDNIQVEFDVVGGSDYIIKYTNIINNRLSNGSTCIWYQLLNGNNPETENTALFTVGGVKEKNIHIPINVDKLVIMMSLSLDVAFETPQEVEFNGLTVIKGGDEISIKDEYFPKQKQDYFELNLPKNFYVATNYQLEIYNKHICYCGNINNYHFKWSLPSGKNMGRKLVINGNDNLNGKTEQLSLEVYNNNLELVATGTSTVHYKKPSQDLAPNDLKSILPIGDSLTELPYWREALKKRLQSEIGDKFYYIGNLGAQEFKHEGHSGWSIDNFTSDTSEGWNGNYKVKVSGDVGSITPKKQYKFDEKIFEFEKKEIESDGTWLYFNRISGGGFVEPNSQAIEVSSSVTGIATIQYTDIAITSYNPFFNPSTRKFDANYYSNNLGIVPDYAFIWLGANGVSESLDRTTNLNSANTNIDKLKIMIDDIISKWSKTKIFVCYNHYYSNQSGLGYVSGTNSFDKGIELGVFNNNKKIKELLENYNNRVILVPIGQTHDSEYNYQFDMVGVNNRNNIAKEMMCYDKVHPFKETGFLQFADTIYSTFINNL